MKTPIALPWPPSVNGYWRSLPPTKPGMPPRVVISKEGREYRKAVAELAAKQAWPKFGAARVRVHIGVAAPDCRARDLDNLLKAPLDALTHAGLWDDDSQIDALAIKRCAVEKGGRMSIWIVPIEPAQGELT